MTRVPFVDLRAMTDEVRPAVETGWRALLDGSCFVGGDVVTRFEREWATFCDARRCVGLANGTDALQLVLRAVGVGPGDEVVVPANTFVATAEAVVLAGATPVFADVDPHTLLVTPATVSAAVTPQTRAVIAVHLFGQMADMTEVAALCRRLDLILVEDAAQAHGARWRGRPPGSESAAACFSFYPGKNLGAFGDAGAIVTNDHDIADAVEELRDHGRAQGSHHTHNRIGTNSRLDPVQAVVLLAKLPRLPIWNILRRHVAEAYAAQLLGTPVTLVDRAPAADHVHHLMVVRLFGRDEVAARLAAAGISTGVHYPTPCHRVPAYRKFSRGPLPVADRAAGEILSLPMFPHLTAAQVEAVCTTLAAAAVHDRLAAL